MFKFFILLTVILVIIEKNRALSLQNNFQHLLERPEYKSWSDLLESKMGNQQYDIDIETKQDEKDIATGLDRKNEILRIQRKHGDLRAVINHTLSKLKNVYSVIGRARHG